MRYVDAKIIGGKNMHPTYAELSSLLNVDFERGIMHWRCDLTSDFDTLWGDTPQAIKNFRIWYSKVAGKPAFCTPTGSGYLQGRYRRRLYKAHRVLWFLHAGEWPVEIDHIDRNRTNNAIGNLRSVTRLENMQNKSRYSNSTSGVPGVSFHARDNMWQAYMHANGKRVGFSWCKTFEEAVAARKEMERNLHT
jgi:hypothetical protein